MMRYGFLTVAMLMGAGVAVGGEPCGPCGEAAFPEAAAFLETHGYPPEDFTVLLSWTQAAPHKKATLIEGYHVLPHDGSAPFDVYSDRQGRLLDEIALAELGVHPKDWNLRPIEQQSELPAPAAKNLPPRPAPVGVAFAIAPSASLQLAPLDVDALLREDEAAELGPDKAPKRIGVVRSLPSSIVLEGSGAGLGSWRVLADGRRLWAITLRSPGAIALRVHFAELAVPKGGQVVVYNSAYPSEAYGPYTERYPGDEGLWAASVFADTVTVECCLPKESDAAGLKLLIDEVAHTYTGFGLWQWANTQEKIAAGPCNQDVSCFPEWSTTARGVAGFAFISNLNQLHCTGALIADTNPSSDIPYFLTAYHCIHLQDGDYSASSMEFFWLYQTGACDGTPPALASVPRTSGGADLLACASASGGTDFTLVRLRNAPPAGLTYIGWSTALLSIGTDVTVIHHPRGDYKRISFGDLIDTGSPGAGGIALQPLEFFHQALWNLGTTEPTSSGSPLMLTDQQLIIGQLWGGLASCDLPEEPDYFGRFDKTYPLVQSWLNPTGDPCDVDNSGAVDSVDLQIVINSVLGKTVSYNADVNASGTTDAIDVQLLILAILNG